MKKELSLKFIWNIRLKLRAEGDKLWAEGDKLWAEGNKLWAEGIIEVYGNIKLEWKNYNKKYQSYECHLETGEIFGYDDDEKEKDNSEDMIQELEKRGKIKNGKIII